MRVNVTIVASAFLSAVVVYVALSALHGPAVPPPSSATLAGVSTANGNNGPVVVVHPAADSASHSSSSSSPSSHASSSSSSASNHASTHVVSTHAPKPSHADCPSCPSCPSDNHNAIATINTAASSAGDQDDELWPVDPEVSMPNIGFACPEPLPALNDKPVYRPKGPKGVRPSNAFFSLLETCQQPYFDTIACQHHEYYHLLTQYISILRQRPRRVRVLQFGLSGCGKSSTSNSQQQQQSLGRAISAWYSFMGSFITALDLHIIEPNRQCAQDFIQQHSTSPIFKNINVVQAADAVKHDAQTNSQNPNANKHFAFERVDDGMGDLNGMRVVFHYTNPNSANEIDTLLNSELKHGSFSYSFDIIVDAGIEVYGATSTTPQVINLQRFFPRVKTGALYIIGGLQSSFHSTFAAEKPTTVQILKQLVDYMNGDPRRQPEVITGIAPDVEHVHCYYELCVLQKFPNYILQNFPFKDSSSWGYGMPTLEQCHPSKGLDGETGHDRQRTVLPGNGLILTGKPFLSACHNSDTDKCKGHTYQTAYERYLTPLRSKLQSVFTASGGNEKGRLRMFEIGLGCKQPNLGASYRMWTEFFADVDVELHIFEYEQACAEEWYSKQTPENKAKVKLHFGDQSNKDDLLRAMKNSGADKELFDVIIDDGGHSMSQQQVTMAVLFPYVKPGGVFFMEDLCTSYHPWFLSQGDYPTTTDGIAMINDWLQGDPRITNLSRANRHGLLRIAPFISHLDFYSKITVLHRKAVAN